jgi:hypothetical protein
MGELLKAIRYRNLDEAKRVLVEALGSDPRIFEDGGGEPEGLLSVIPEDRLSEEEWVRLFGLKKGVLVEVEKTHYSGFGPPADEQDYMGFVSERTAYILKGAHLPVEIKDCSFGATDIHHLDLLVLEGRHPLNREQLQRALNLPADWDFETLFERIVDGEATAQEIDRLIHRGIQ